MKYSINLTFIGARKPNKDQQFILSEAFKYAFLVEDFPDIDGRGIDSKIEDEYISYDSIKNIPTYMCCVGFLCIMEIWDFQGTHSFVTSADTPSGLPQDKWRRFKSICDSYEINRVSNSVG